MTKLLKKIGECDAGQSDICRNGEELQVHLTDRNMWLCDECLAKERAVEARTAEAKQLVQKFQQVDQHIQLVTDLHNAATEPIVTLRAAIFANEEIPSDRKEYFFCKEVEKHIEILDAAMFTRRQELQQMENERRAWQTNGQSAAGKLRLELQSEFKSFDVNYKPVAVKKIKPEVVKVPKISKKELVRQAHEMGQKYGVPEANVLMMMTGTNRTAEEAAKDLAQRLGKLKHLEVAPKVGEQ